MSASSGGRGGPPPRKAGGGGPREGCGFKRKKILAQYNLDLTTIPAEKIKKIDKLSSKKGREFLQQLKPDLLIVNGTRILSKKTLESVSAPFVNIHTGITPAYRGVHGGYWAVAKGQKDFLVLQFITLIRELIQVVSLNRFLQNPERKIIFIHIHMFNMQQCFRC